MKKSLSLLVVGMIPALASALPFTLQPTSLWKKTADDAAVIEYDGRKAWPYLKLKTAEPLKPNTLYRITFEAKISAPERIFSGFEPVIQSKKQRLYTPFFPTADYRKYTVYFNSGETPKGTPGIYFNPTSAFQMEVKGIKLDEISEVSLYGKNLLPCGNFDEGNPFYPYKKEMKKHLKIVDSAEFMSGEKSLLLDCHGKRLDQHGLFEWDPDEDFSTLIFLPDTQIEIPQTDRFLFHSPFQVIFLRFFRSDC